MVELELFLPATPEEAARIMRARALPPTSTTDVTVFTRRAACPDGVSVGVRVEHDRLRLTEVPGEVLVNQWAVGPEDTSS